MQSTTATPPIRLRGVNLGGWLVLEHGDGQAEAVRGLLRAHGFVEVASWRDLSGIERVTEGRTPP